MTSAVGADPLLKRRLLSTYFVNAYLLRGADIGYLIIGSLTELSFINVKDMASFIKLSGWFTSVR